jgi:hypothetical protein
MKESIYYFDVLKPFDKWTIGLYITLSLGLSYYFVTEKSPENNADIIFMYGLGTQIILYMFCYRSLCKLPRFSTLQK